MSTVSNGTSLHTWVEGEGYKRRGLGEGRGEGDLAWNISSCRHQWQSLKEQVKM